MNIEDEYKDAQFYLENTKRKRIPPEITDTLRLTQEFNQKFFDIYKKQINISCFSVMMDDIKNYRPLSELQLTQIESLSEEEKIKIIKIYNTMFASIEYIING